MFVHAWFCYWRLLYSILSMEILFLPFMFLWVYPIEITVSVLEQAHIEFQKLYLRKVGRFPLVFCSFLEDMKWSIKMVSTDCFRNNDQNLLTRLYWNVFSLYWSSGNRWHMLIISEYYRMVKNARRKNYLCILPGAEYKYLQQNPLYLKSVLNKVSSLFLQKQ